MSFVPAALHLAGVVSLSTLQDLKRVVVPILDVVSGSPGEGVSVGLSGNRLDLLHISGRTLAQAYGDRLEQSASLHSCPRA